MDSDFIQAVDKLFDTDDTTVGGGCASALSGAMAAGMIGMVAKLSKKCPVNFTGVQYDEVAAECDNLVIQLQKGCVDDTKAYCMIVDAVKLPKGTADEKAARSVAIQGAAKKAAEVPRSNARLCARVHALGAMLKGNSNPACVSDLTSALYLSESAVKDCILNIQANLGMIKDESICTALKEDMLELLLQAICY